MASETCSDCRRHLDMLYALIFAKWTLETRYFPGEELEGWVWIEPNGTEHLVKGSWEALPPWPDPAARRSRLVEGGEEFERVRAAGGCAGR
jgi:hypothetical protein